MMDEKLCEQYAARVIGFSSQFSASDNGAIQLLGAPKHFPSSGSHTGCWSALPQPGRLSEWVRLGLRTPVNVAELHIYETLHPGSVSRVRLSSVSDPHDEQWTVAWDRSSDTTAAAQARATLPSSRIFSPPLSAEALSVPCVIIPSSRHRHPHRHSDHSLIQ